MKKKFILILLICLGTVACQAKEFRIKGKIEGGEGMKVYLVDNSGEEQVVDSTMIKNGKFEFRGKLEFPELYHIMIYKDKEHPNLWKNIVKLPVFIDNTTIEIKAPYDSLPTKVSTVVSPGVKIVGEGLTDLYVAYEKGYDQLKLKDKACMEAYVKAYYYAIADEQGRIDLKPTYAAIKQCRKCTEAIYQYKLDFIRQHADSPLALYVAGSLSLKKYGRQEIAKVLALLSEKLRNCPQGKALEEKWNTVPLYVGDKYKNLKVLNIQGEIVNISDYIRPERYTLLEVWASWCGPCRSEIPHLKQTYSTYHDRGFDIVSVSIDRDKENWKKALEDEKMPWIQLCDKEKGWNAHIVKTYDIRGVPASFLINPEGEILQIDARGGWLDTRLMELLGK